VISLKSMNIEACYDSEHLEKMFILGDGVSWIEGGTRILESKCKFVLVGFHSSFSESKLTQPKFLKVLVKRGV